MPTVYQHDKAGHYLGTCGDHNGPLPHNCAAPPALPALEAGKKFRSALNTGLPDCGGLPITAS